MSIPFLLDSFSAGSKSQCCFGRLGRRRRSDPRARVPYGGWRAPSWVKGTATMRLRSESRPTVELKRKSITNCVRRPSRSTRSGSKDFPAVPATKTSKLRQPAKIAYSALRLFCPRSSGSFPRYLIQKFPQDRNYLQRSLFLRDMAGVRDNDEPAPRQDFADALGSRAFHHYVPFAPYV